MTWDKRIVDDGKKRSRNCKLGWMNRHNAENYIMKVTDLNRPEVQDCMEAFFQFLMKALIAGKFVQLRGFASFKVVQRPGSSRFNAHAKRIIDVPPYYKPVIQFSPDFKKMVDKSLTHGEYEDIKRQMEKLERPKRYIPIKNQDFD